MKYLLVAYSLVFMFIGTAWACESIPIEYRTACYNEVRKAEQLAAQQAWSAQVEANVRAMQQQQELARIQANGLAAFGSGNALINGMNQGFQNMQIHPYVLPPPRHIPTR